MNLIRIVKGLIFLAFSFPGGIALGQTQSWMLQSPDKSLTSYVKLDDSGRLFYRVESVEKKKSMEALGWSRLGLKLKPVNSATSPFTKNVDDFTSGLSFVDIKTENTNEEYAMLSGKRRINSVRYTQTNFKFLTDTSDVVLTLEYRMFDTGVAFRYRFLQQSNLPYELVSDLTEFNVGAGNLHWGQPYDKVSLYSPAYETTFKQFTSGTSVDSDEGTGWGFPSLFNKNNIWVLLHESGVGNENYGAHLEASADRGVYRVAPPLPDEVHGYGSENAVSNLPWTLPWRFAVISNDLGDVVESNRVFDLASPREIKDISWIKPGISSWSWWSDHGSSRDMKRLKDFIDLSEKFGWPYSLIDANWNLISDNAMEELVSYADKKNVGLWFWYNSGGSHNRVGEQPRNKLSERDKRRAEFRRISGLGVKGVKVDFFNSDKQFIMQRYLDILEDAADYKLLVNFHGSTVPRGWSRTWPNLMTMEGVRGAEYYTFSHDFGPSAPQLNTILPFTRNVIGSMDYTPVTFSPEAKHRVTTKAHEIALSVVFESGTQHFADSVESYLKLPQAFQNLLSKMPTAWDDTVFVEGYPGKLAVVARKKDNSWYVAGINGEAQKKKISMDLSPFLSNKALKVYTDGENGALHSYTHMLDKKNEYELEVTGNGGFVIVL